MSTVRVADVGRQSLERAALLLAGIPGGVEQAAKNAVTRAASQLRSSSTAEIRKVYDISAASLRAEQNITIRYVYRPGSGVEANVTFWGRKIPLYRFGGASPKRPGQDTSQVVHAIIQGKWRTVHPGTAAAGHQLKRTAPTRFGHAFVAAMKSGHVGIFERTGGSTSSGGDAIRELMGSSVPQMLGSQTVTEALTREAMDYFETRLEHEIARILQGGGR